MIPPVDVSLKTGAGVGEVAYWDSLWVVVGVGDSITGMES